MGNISCPGVLNIGVFVGIFVGTLNVNNKGGFWVSFSFTTGIGLNVKSCFGVTTGALNGNPPFF